MYYLEKISVPQNVINPFKDNIKTPKLHNLYVFCYLYMYLDTA